MKGHVSTATRRVVLMLAFAAGLAAWLLPQPATVRAMPSDEATVRLALAAEKDAGSAQSAKDPKAEADDKAKDDEKLDADITIDKGGITVKKDRKRIRLDGLSHDREYQSFEDFVQDAPWLAGLVFLVVLLVFLVPLLIIVLLIWYKVRKNRMMNETMVRLAEQGVVPPAQAMEALSADKVAPTITAAPATAPLYEQARLHRRRAAWSDLRKGVIMVAVGLGFSVYSMFDDGTPNGLGIVLLFVGIGYCVLWFFEEREPQRADMTPPGPGGTPRPPGGV